jgi:hypothetical protein
VNVAWPTVEKAGRTEKRPNMNARPKPPREPLERVAGFLALFCIATLVVLFSKPTFTNAAKPQHGIGDPVLALQLAHDVSDVEAILSDAPSPDREVMRLKQYEDFGYIAGYGVLFVTLSLMLARRYPALKLVAILVALTGCAAAALDVVENFAILRIVDVKIADTTQGMVDAIRHAAVPKWALGFIAAGLSSIYYLKDPRRSARVAGAFFVIGAIVGLYGLTFNNAILLFGAVFLMLGLAGSVIVFLLLP